MGQEWVHIGKIKIPDIVEKIGIEPTEELKQSIIKEGQQEPIYVVEFYHYNYTQYYILDGGKRYKILRKIYKGKEEEYESIWIAKLKLNMRQYNELIVLKILDEIDINKLPISVYSELVLLYYSAVMNQGKRSDLKGQKSETTEENEKEGIKLCADKFGISQRQISRYIRIPNCVQRVLERLDSKNISLRASVELSYLKEEQQEMIVELFERKNKKMTYLRMNYIRTCIEKGYCSNYKYIVVRGCLIEEKILLADMEKIKERVRIYKEEKNAALGKWKELYDEEEHWRELHG